MTDHFFTFGKLDYIKNKDRTPGCVFCRMKEEDQGLNLYKNEHALVMLNLYPYNPAHLMIIPLRHVKDIRELTEEESLAIFRLEKNFLSILDKVYAPQGFNIGYNLGQTAGGSQEHLHLHIIPRYKNEVGVAELIGGAKVLVEDPRVTREKLLREIKRKLF